MTIDIVISPNILNLQNARQWVTVHSNMAYSLVAGASVTLDDVPINWWKSDTQGNFAAKFVIGDIKNVGAGFQTLCLEGVTKDGSFIKVVMI